VPLAADVSSQKVDVVVSREALSTAWPAHVLSEAGIDLIVTEAATLDEVLGRVTGERRP
jgi:predicted Fe-Mo cluster-binding NifX family protein